MRRFKGIKKFLGLTLALATIFVSVPQVYAKCSHSYITLTVREANCTTQGVIYLKCTKCSEKTPQRTTTTNPNKHNYVMKTKSPATCTTQGVVYDECTRCKKAINERKTTTNPNNHLYRTYTIQSTCKAEGKSYDRCLRCSKTINEKTLQKKSHNMTFKVENDNYVYKCASCNTLSYNYSNLPINSTVANLVNSGQVYSTLMIPKTMAGNNGYLQSNKRNPYCQKDYASKYGVDVPAEGCNAVAYCMGMNYLHNNNLDPSEFLSGNAKYEEREGTYYNLDCVRDRLKQGKPSIVSYKYDGGSHYVLVVGMKASAANRSTNSSDYIVIDPSFGKLTMLNEREGMGAIEYICPFK